MTTGWQRAMAGLAILLSVLVMFAPGSRAGEAGILDEYNADLSLGPDLQRLTVGLTFGDVKTGGFWWSYGARIGSLSFDNGAVDRRGWVAGGTVGFGFDPLKRVSPVAGLSLDYPFGFDGKIDLVTQVHGGVRIRLNNAPEHFALTVAAFWSGLFLGDGLADDSDGGIAVLFSAASFRSR